MRTSKDELNWAISYSSQWTPCSLVAGCDLRTLSFAWGNHMLLSSSSLSSTPVNTSKRICWFREVLIKMRAKTQCSFYHLFWRKKSRWDISTHTDTWGGGFSSRFWRNETCLLFASGACILTHRFSLQH